ncbi:hypothetical protein CVT24_008899 [Panaeolus cyanescens]|uniref:Wbp11/ELF5/Saf1 N-terminal domain-containing protein n=1 Tax=Panaeolus cyanescens TaxID=181874 RepID=A0A409VAY4_9AGAR|nr:hypothetical protein CVT24_008899 [Panaeolus cyanescens]
MAKKNLNPADAYRQQSPEEERAKKGTNKAERSKARDLAVVKKDTTDLEIVIKELEADRSDPQKLAELKAELEKINKKKAEYVAEHPEARKLVYRRRREGEPEPELPTVKRRNPFKKNGLPKHPERSIYYDPVLNPFGVAPPGMPYIERPLLPGEVDSEEEDAHEDEPMSDEDDIPLPSGLPPGSEEVTSDDEIQMPDGPPPGHEMDEDDDIPLPPIPSESIPQLPSTMMPPLPPGMPPNQIPTGILPPPPPPPPGFALPGNVPPPPPGFLPGMMNMPPPPPGFAPGFSGIPPPPPPPFGFPPTMPNMPPPPGFNPYHNAPFPPFAPNAFPPPPNKFLPRQQSTSAMQDPLSSIPHQTFQAHKASHLATPHPSLPQNPNKTVPPPPSLPHNPSLPAKPIAAAATVVAAPQLRDLKKEATAFVPTAVKRKKAAVEAPKFNAAPDVGPSDANSSAEIGPSKPDLLGALKNQFGPKPVEQKTKAAQQTDYDKFMAEMGDILGPQ